MQSVQSIEIAATAGEVFSILRRWDLREKWRPGIGVVWEGGPEARPGQWVEFQKPPFARWKIKITGLEGFRLHWDYLEGPLRGRAALVVEPLGGGSRVSFYWMKVEAFGWLSRIYFALGWGAESHRRGVEETLRMLKEYAQRPGAKAP
jgi:hypothetical protein